MNGLGKLRRRTERTGVVVDFSLCLAAFVVACCLIRQARTGYQFGSQPGGSHDAFAGRG